MIKEVKKCDKCDERGMIVEIKDGAHYGHSCDCGYYNYLMKKRFEGVSIESLLEYAGKRIEQKGGKNPFAVNLGKLGGKSTSPLKVNASKENGKKGGRPKSTPLSNITNMEKEHLTLKWGTLKSWSFGDWSKPLFEEYSKIGSSDSAIMQHDTPRQKEILCELIDKGSFEKVYLDWDGKEINKEEAKKYVMEYGVKSAPSVT